MFAATNEAGGTSFRSRYDDQKFMFAGKTGSSQTKIHRITRELEIKQKDIEYKDRDHALFVAFAPYSDPKYAISVVVEHGGTGSGSAAPIAKKVIKVLERDQFRKCKKFNWRRNIMFNQIDSIFNDFKRQNYVYGFHFNFIHIVIGNCKHVCNVFYDGGKFDYHTKSHILRFDFFLNVYGNLLISN